MTEEYRNTLPQGTMIDSYRVERVLGVGGFGVTYLVSDLNLGKEYAMKELLPDGIAIRNAGDTTVMAKSQSAEEDFEATRRYFISEARILAKMKHPAVVAVQRLMEAKGDAWGSATGIGAEQPMYFVNWNDCQAFIKKVNESGTLPKGMKLALPTEAQWEYACRAGSTGKYAGTGNLDTMGWYRDNSKSSPHPVGEKRANAWGLKDMHGNVWEWCWDWYDGKYYGTGAARRDPTGANGGLYRVLRGGSWNSDAGFCRSAVRAGYRPGYRYGGIGFRLSLQVETR